MATLTPAQVLAVVSDLARGRSTIDVAGRHHIPAATAIEIRNHYGPDLGQLAKAAERLKAEQGRPMLDKAIAVPSLRARAEKVLALLTSIRNDLANAEKIAGLEAIAKKRADELAAAKKALAEAKGIKPKPTTAPLTSSESAQIREWAKVQGLAVSTAGRIPAAIRAQWEALGKA